MPHKDAFYTLQRGLLYKEKVSTNTYASLIYTLIAAVVSCAPQTVDKVKRRGQNTIWQQTLACHKCCRESQQLHLYLTFQLFTSLSPFASLSLANEVSYLACQLKCPMPKPMIPINTF